MRDSSQHEPDRRCRGICGTFIALAINGEKQGLLLTTKTIESSTAAETLLCSALVLSACNAAAVHASSGMESCVPQMLNGRQRLLSQTNKDTQKLMV